MAASQGGVPLESFEKSPRVVFRLTWGGTEDPSEDGGARLPRPVLSPVEMNVAEQGLKHVRSRRNGEPDAPSCTLLLARPVRAPAFIYFNEGPLTLKV